VAPPRHPHRAHPTRASSAKRPARTYASYAEDGGHQARGRQRVPAAVRFDTFLERYNHRRPQQALGMKSPPTSTRDRRVSTGDSMSSPTPFTTTRSPSPGVAASASNAAKSISATSSPARASASPRWPSGSGSSLSCSTIWATLTMRRADSNRSIIRSARKCYLCPRNELLPVCPEWTDKKWSRRRDLNPRPADYETRAGAEPALSSFAYLRVTA
jgi:hypothetical protein